MPGQPYHLYLAVAQACLEAQSTIVHPARENPEFIVTAHQEWFTIPGNVSQFPVVKRLQVVGTP
jgi:hypothetical protein